MDADDERGQERDISSSIDSKTISSSCCDFQQLCPGSWVGVGDARERRVAANSLATNRRSAGDDVAHRILRPQIRSS